MKSSIFYAILAGTAWGLGGYFEKSGLRLLGLPPIAGITLRTLVALVVLGLLSIPAWKGISTSGSIPAWLMIIIGGGVVAGSLGMWSFYTALSTSENLGVTLALAFAFSPIAGTLIGLLRGDQPVSLPIGVGLAAIVFGIAVIQLAPKH
jgi:transporter family protein